MSEKIVLANNPYFAAFLDCVMNSLNDELLEIVDGDGRVLGTEKRSVVHGNPALLHRVIHVLVFNTAGQLLLQKRSMNKDTAPGKWDTSVGGHCNPGEADSAAAIREMDEELGIKGHPVDFLYRHIYRNRIESELVSTFLCRYDGEISFNRDEIDDVAYWDLEDIRSKLGSGCFSGNFETEIRIYFRSKGSDPSFV